MELLKPFVFPNPFYSLSFTSLFLEEKKRNSRKKIWFEVFSMKKKWCQWKEKKKMYTKGRAMCFLPISNTGERVDVTIVKEKLLGIYLTGLRVVFMSSLTKQWIEIHALVTYRELMYWLLWSIMIIAKDGGIQISFLLCLSSLSFLLCCPADNQSFFFLPLFLHSALSSPFTLTHVFSSLSLSLSFLLAIFSIVTFAFSRRLHRRRFLLPTAILSSLSSFSSTSSSSSPSSISIFHPLYSLAERRSFTLYK